MKQYAALGDTVYFWFAANNTSGSGADGSSPAAHVRLAGALASAAPVHSPTPALLTHASYPAGAYEIAIAATALNGFAVNNTYAIFCTLAVDSQNPTGFVGSFDLKPIEANVKQIGGDAQSATDLKDFADFGYDPATNKIEACKVNDDMRGTNSAALASVCTEVRLARLDAAISSRSSHSAADVWIAANRGLSTPADYKADVSALALEATLTAMEGATFVGATDSLEAIRDRGDAAWISATGFSTHSAASVWAVATRALTDKVGFVLSDAARLAIWHELLANITTINTIGKLIKDNLDAAITSRSSHTAPNVWTAANRELSTPNNYKADVSALALESTLTAMKGTGWTNETLKAIKDAIIALNDPTAAAITDAVWDELQSGHTTAGTFGKYLDAQISGVGGAVGPGALSCTWTQKDSSNNPIDNCQVWITTDQAGTNVIAGTLLTDASGNVTFMLDAGTYYVWREKGGYNFTNPQTWTVS